MEPTLPFSSNKVRLSAATTGTKRKPKNVDFSRGEGTVGNGGQTGAKRRYLGFFRLLTGGLQVRVLPEEPNLSTTYTDELGRFDHI